MGSSAAEARSSSCIAGGDPCLDSSLNSLGSCCSGATCTPAPLGDSSGYCVMTSSETCVAPGFPCYSLTSGTSLGSCCSGTTCAPIMGSTQQGGFCLRISSSSSSCIARGSACLDTSFNSLGSCCPGATCTPVRGDTGAGGRCQSMSSSSSCIAQGSACLDNSFPSLGSCCAGATCTPVTGDTGAGGRCQSMSSSSSSCIARGSAS